MMAVAEGQKCNGTCILLDTMALGGRRTDGSNTARRALHAVLADAR